MRTADHMAAVWVARDADEEGPTDFIAISAN